MLYVEQRRGGRRLACHFRRARLQALLEHDRRQGTDVASKALNMALSNSLAIQQGCAPGRTGIQVSTSNDDLYPLIIELNPHSGSKLVSTESSIATIGTGCAPRRLP